VFTGTLSCLHLLQGMVLTDPVQKPRSCLGFWADVFLLFHTTSISKRFQATVYIGNVIQTAVIEEMNKVYKKCQQILINKFFSNTGMV